MTRGKWQVSNGGGDSPLWSPDARELYYRSGDATMAVAVETGPAFKRGNPEVLFRGIYVSSGQQNITSTSWDIHPKSRRFLMIKPPAPAGAVPAAAAVPQPKIVVVLNWFEELKARMPVK